MAVAWNYIPANTWRAPEAPSGAPVRKGIGALLDWVRQRRQKPDEVSPPEEPLSEARKSELVGVVDWSPAVAALDVALAPWLEAETPDVPLRVVLYRPQSAGREILEMWCQAHTWHWGETPRISELLKDSSGALKLVRDTGDRPLVLGSLESHFLRHHQGLEHLRELTVMLMNRSERALIGCSTWAWAFLKRALLIDALFPTPFTLQAFDSANTDTWLASLNPDLKLFEVNEEDVPEKRKESASPTTQLGVAESWLKELAHFCRGEPALIHTLLREALVNETREGAQGVRPWSKMDLPKLPPSGGRLEIFALHALLIHAPLTTSIMSDVLFPSFPELHRSLQLLREARLIEERKGHWYLTPLGYPVVRRLLNNEGYLTDED